MRYIQAVSIVAPIPILMLFCTGSYVLLRASFARARAFAYFIVLVLQAALRISMQCSLWLSFPSDLSSRLLVDESGLNKK